MQDEHERILWLVAAPDTDWKSRRAQDADEPIFRNRGNINKLAELTAVQQAAVQHGINLAEEPANRIIAVAKVTPHMCYDELCDLTAAERLQYRIWRRMRGGTMVGLLYFFAVKALVRLPVRTPMLGIAARKDRSFFVNFRDEQLEDLMQQLHDHGSIPAWLVNARAPPVTGVRLPKAIALLCGLGHWPTFALCDLSDGLYHGWLLGKLLCPWHELPRARWPSVEEDDHATDLLESSVSLATEQIRELAALLRAGADPGGLQEVFARTHHIMCSLQAQMDDIIENFDIARHKNKAYEIYFLLNCFWLCGLLKADSRLGDSLELSCRILLPKRIADSVLNSVKETCISLPSPSTISRLRVKIDVAFMMCMRDALQRMLATRERVTTRVKTN